MCLQAPVILNLKKKIRSEAFLHRKIIQDTILQKAIHYNMSRFPTNWFLCPKTQKMPFRGKLISSLKTGHIRYFKNFFFYNVFQPTREHPPSVPQVGRGFVNNGVHYVNLYSITIFGILTIKRNIIYIVRTAIIVIPNKQMYELQFL